MEIVKDRLFNLSEVDNNILHSSFQEVSIPSLDYCISKI